MQRTDCTSMRKIILLIGALFSLFLFFLFSDLSKNVTCPSNIKNISVHGKSMAGIIEDNSEIKADFFFYSCNSIQNNDVVIIKLDNAYLIKTISGIPGDKMSIQNRGRFSYILINSNILTDINKKPYLVDSTSSDKWNFYLNSTEGKLTENQYFVTGSISSGSFDSVKFGTIRKEQIVAKVLINSKFK